VNKFKSAVLYVSAAALVLVTAGCNLEFWKKRERVAVQAQVLDTKKKCRKAFGNRGKRILGKKSKRIYPVKLTIENKDSRPWKLTKHNVGLRTVDIETIKKRMQRRPLWQAFFYGIGGFFQQLAGSILCGFGLGALENIDNPVLALFFAIPSFIGSAILSFKGKMATTVGYVDAKMNNEKAKETIDQISLAQDTVVQPLEKKERFVFVKAKNFKERFSLTFTDAFGKKEVIEASCLYNLA